MFPVFKNIHLVCAMVIYKGQRMTCGIWFSTSAMGSGMGVGVEVGVTHRLSGLVAGGRWQVALPQSISPAPRTCFISTCSCLMPFPEPLESQELGRPSLDKEPCGTL